MTNNHILTAAARSESNDSFIPFREAQQLSGDAPRLIDVNSRGASFALRS